MGYFVDNVPSVDCLIWITRIISSSLFHTLHHSSDMFFHHAVELISIPISIVEPISIGKMPDKGVSSELLTVVDGLLEIVDALIQVVHSSPWLGKLWLAEVLGRTDVEFPIEHSPVLVVTFSWRLKSRAD